MVSGHSPPENCPPRTTALPSEIPPQDNYHRTFSPGHLPLNNSPLTTTPRTIAPYEIPPKGKYPSPRTFAPPPDNYP